MTAQRITRILAASCLLLLSAIASAQVLGSGSIGGQAKDTTGAVLPGVTVEASSPALIEKARTVVTDDQGRYQIVDLRPGAYTVTFSLPGFSTFLREGIELTTAFAATVNAEMKVGSVEETVTVTEASPLVDVQATTAQNVFKQNVLDALPTGKSMTAYATLIPGAVSGNSAYQDVGGTASEQSANFRVHGNRNNDFKVYTDGNNYNSLSGAGNFAYSINRASVEEITVSPGGVGAESETGGVSVNVIPKEGANIFSGNFATSYTNPNLQSNNLNDSLVARGINAVNSIKRLYDVSFGVGGPITKDKLWFFTGHRWWGTQLYIAGNYWNKIQNTLFYQPDLTRQAYQDDYYKTNDLRLTWQVTGKQKVSLTYGNGNHSCACFWAIQGGGIAPEATGADRYAPNYLAAVSWTYPLTNRLLLEAGGSHFLWNLNGEPEPGVTTNDISIVELSTGYRYHGRGHGFGTTTAYGYNIFRNITERFSVSYVTGTHAFKTGMYLQEGTGTHYLEVPQGIGYSFRNQLPASVTLWASPHSDIERLRPNLGIYTQDQWTISKLTLNLGVRFDYVNAFVPAQQLSAGAYVPARSFDAVYNVPNWKDISPRVGGSYDLLGNGKTAVKAFLGKYLDASYLTLASNINPSNTSVNSATRTWNDTNGNYVPDCNLTAPASNGECGALSPTTFGQPRIVTSYADDVLTGWGHRGYNWQGSVSVQHELRTGLAMNVGYFRTWYGNFTVTDNQAVTAADFSPYCATAPVDARLPGGGGNQVCGFYDVSPAKFGQNNNLVELSSHYGNQSEVFNGFDVTINARLKQGGVLSGGMSVGKTTTDNCFGNDLPNLTLTGGSVLSTSTTTPRTQAFCHASSPWSAGTPFKMAGSYPLPWDVQASATFQTLPGIPQTASYTATNAEIAPSLGRNLAAGANGNVVVELVPNNTQFEGRSTQLDLRLGRTFRVGRVRAQGNFDLYNVLNASPILGITNRIGSAFLQPTAVLAGRLVKFGVQVNF